MFSKFKPIAAHVYTNRNRYATVGAVATVTVLKRAHTKWDEYKLDFQMYDEFNRPRKK